MAAFQSLAPPSELAATGPAGAAFGPVPAQPQPVFVQAPPPSGGVPWAWLILGLVVVAGVVALVVFWDRIPWPGGKAVRAQAPPDEADRVAEILAERMYREMMSEDYDGADDGADDDGAVGGGPAAPAGPGRRPGAFSGGGGRGKPGAAAPKAFKVDAFPVRDLEGNVHARFEDPDLRREDS